MKKSYKAFTLIELLIVLGLNAILLAVTIIAINPVAQFRSANNIYTQSNTRQLFNALKQCFVDNKGNYANCYALSPGLPTTEPTTAGEVSGTGGLTSPRTTYLDKDTPNFGGQYAPVLIGRYESTAMSGTNYDHWYYIDLCPLVTGGYIQGIPCSPGNGTGCNGGYLSLGKTFECTSSITAYYSGSYIRVMNGRLCIYSIPGSNFGNADNYTICDNY